MNLIRTPAVCRTRITGMGQLRDICLTGIHMHAFAELHRTMPSHTPDQSPESVTEADEHIKAVIDQAWDAL
jgi:hypothetical protein